MSESIEEVESFELVSLPEAYKIISMVVERMQKKNRPVKDVVKNTLNYLSKLSKCSPEAAEKARKRLIEEGFAPITAAMMVSILPDTVHEARVLLDFEKRLVETEELEKALQILREECGSPSTEA